MTKLLTFLGLLIFILSCQFQAANNEISINRDKLLYDLKVISHDSLEGRFFGTKGNEKAQRFIAKRFAEINIPSAFHEGGIQKYTYTFSGKNRHRMYPISNPNEDFSNVPDTTVIGGNVVTMLKGEVEKTIVVTAHLDHLGIRNSEIYNGADDDASGSAALLSIAEYFKKKPTKHSLIFAAVDAEEIGSLGCEYLLSNFPIEISKIALNINLDMIAHNDSLKLYASGLYHYPQLKEPLDKIDSKINLLYGHDDPNNDKLDDWTFASDHRVFHKRDIPFIYFGVEDHKDYHKSTDTFENINQEFYIETVKLIIQAIENYDQFLLTK